MRPSDVTVEEWEEALENLPCNICKKNVQGDDDKLLLCDLCNFGFHIFCLTPPLYEIPKDSWFCDNCKQEINERRDVAKDTLIEEQLINRKRSILLDESQDKSERDYDSGSSEPVQRKKQYSQSYIDIYII